MAKSKISVSSGEAWLAVAAGRALLEWELVGSVVSDPARGVALAVDSGMEPSWLEEDDLRIVYGAALTLWRQGVLAAPPTPSLDALLEEPEAAKLERWCLRSTARRRLYLLAAERLGAAGISCLKPRWDAGAADGLRRLFDSFPGPCGVPLYAARLSAVAGLVRDARDHLRYGRRLIDRLAEQSGRGWRDLGTGVAR